MTDDTRTSPRLLEQLSSRAIEPIVRAVRTEIGRAKREVADRARSARTGIVLVAVAAVLVLVTAGLLAAALGAERHVVLPLDLSLFGGSALTDATPVPKGGVGEGIPVTYVPARNTIFLSLALGWAEATGARDLFIGVNALDYSGYPDCRPEFLTAFEALADLATKAGVEGGKFRVHSPLLKMTKAEIIREGVRLGVDYSTTLSCYDPDATGRACGNCDSCQLRKKGFAEAGVTDPTVYR